MVICYLLFPETKNKTLEEIGLLFGDTNVRPMPSATIESSAIDHDRLPGEKKENADRHIEEMGFERA